MISLQTGLQLQIIQERQQIPTLEPIQIRKLSEVKNHKLTKLEKEKFYFSELNPLRFIKKKIHERKFKSKFSIKDVPEKTLKLFKKIYGKVFSKKDKRGITLIDSKILELLKEKSKGMDCKDKWIKIGIKEKEVKK